MLQASRTPRVPGAALPNFYAKSSDAIGRFYASGNAPLPRSSATYMAPLGLRGGGATDAPKRSLQPVVLCGPSGVGKGAMLGKLMAECPDDFGFSVSHTTRGPRPGEEDGVHYHFSTVEAMEAAIARGEFIEHARVHTNIYGTSVKAVNDVKAAGKTCLLDIDIQGAQSVKQTSLDARFVFVAPPSFETLEARLRGRGTETEEKILVRLKNSRDEIEFSKTPGFWDLVIVNDDLTTAVDELKAFLGAAPAPPAVA